MDAQAKRIAPDGRGVICIGRLKENLVTEVELPPPRFCGGSYAILLQRPNEKQPYPVNAREEDGILVWAVQAADTAIAGTGKLECRWYGENGEVAKSQVYLIRIMDGLADPTDPPEAWEGYVAQVARDAKSAANSASDSGKSAGEAAAAALAAQNAQGKAGDFAESAIVAATAANKAAENAQGLVAAAGTAIDAATSAAEATNTAADGAEKVNISAEQTPTGANITITDRTGAATTVHIDTLPAINTWADIRNAVSLGLGATYFPVGYEFTTFDADTKQNIVWVVRAHDYHTAANNNLTHTMTLETKYVYSLASGAQKAIQYDATEAFYFAEQGLAVGTYNITIANQVWYTADNGKTFQFTLTKAVPAGGQLVFAMTYNATLEGKSVKSYTNKTTTTALETVTLTEGSEGTSLGTTNGNSPNVNHMHRTIFGSNNYAQSAVRQWLNSAAVAGSVWTPTNIFDRPASWDTSYNGFMHGLPADFLAVVQPAVLACRTNSLFEVESLDGTSFAVNQVYELQDKFFLLSRPEIFGDWDSADYKDGTQLEYYNGLTATERIKRDVAGTDHYAWLRSPSPFYSAYGRIVNATGALGDNIAHSSDGVAPACIIA